MAYKLIKTIDPENQFDRTNVTIEIPHSDAGLVELLEAFQEFLRACGFQFSGEIDLVDKEGE
jgi:hypothetical protein